MSSPISEDPNRYRPRWRRRRRKWYVKLAAAIQDRVAGFGWRTWSGLGVAFAALLLAIYNPLVVPGTHAPRGDPIDCLIPGQSRFGNVCTVEEAASPDGKVLTVRAPDGEFRRLLIVRDGRGVIAADGAEEVRVKPAGAGRIDVKAGEIVWRLPARVKQ